MWVLGIELRPLEDLSVLLTIEPTLHAGGWDGGVGGVLSLTLDVPSGICRDDRRKAPDLPP